MLHRGVSVEKNREFGSVKEWWFWGVWLFLLSVYTEGLWGINGFAVTYLALNWPPGAGYFWLYMGDLDLSMLMHFPTCVLEVVWCWKRKELIRN